jgi:beta-galactosidase
MTMRRIWLVVTVACGLGWTTGAQRTVQATDTPMRLADGWRFHKGDIAGAASVAFDDSTWETVRVPHTWNAADSYSEDFYRGPGWYRRTLAIPSAWKGKRVFIRFQAVGRTAEVFLDGTRVGEHRSAFSAFAFEITRQVTPGRTHVLAVRADNAYSEDLPPISGDFNIFGGIYRPVTLFARDAICITPLDYASPGVYLTQRDVGADKADLEVTTKVSNGGTTAAEVETWVTVLDAAGAPVASGRQRAHVGAGETIPVVQRVSVNRPHLWQGTSDPYLYSARVDVRHGRTVTDTVNQPLGLRRIEVRAADGFFLNGKPYTIRGVNRHQDREGVGWALTEKEQDEDMRILRELGINGIRLAHYQHNDYFYSLCDRTGLVVWAENCLVNEVRASETFNAAARLQLVELIRQNYNHPSIVMWSLSNELGLRTRIDPAPLHKILQATAKAEDPIRPTVAAASQSDLTKWRDMVATPDLLAANLYPGWYSGTPDQLGDLLDKTNASYGSKGLALSEYGAGAAPSQHQQGMTARPDPRGRWHPEEWQAIQHEAAWAAIKARPFVWGSFVWVMFDFASASRKEGDRDGVNDKGLVTADRTLRKDAFFFYKANWTDTPMVYIASRRHVDRTEALTDVKVYSNCPRVTLKVNGASLGEARPNDVRVFVWKNVRLAPGANIIEAEAPAGDRTVRDTCTWTLRASTQVAAPGRVASAR